MTQETSGILDKCVEVLAAAIAASAEPSRRHEDIEDRHALSSSMTSLVTQLLGLPEGHPGRDGALEAFNHALRTGAITIHYVVRAPEEPTDEAEADEVSVEEVSHGG